MKFSIRLSDDGPPFWMLGDPSNIRVHLTMSDPGPVEVDFQDLSDVERGRVLVDIQRRQIETDTPFEDLKKVYLQLQKPPEPKQEVQQHLAQQQRYNEAQEALRRQEKREKAQKKFDSKVNWLCKMTARALTNALRKEEDLRVLRTVREREYDRKRTRASVVRFIDQKIKKIQVGVIQEIERTKDEKAKPLNPSAKDAKSKTFVSDVVESDGEVVQFSNEDLERLASGEEL